MDSKDDDEILISSKHLLQFNIGNVYKDEVWHNFYQHGCSGRNNNSSKGQLGAHIASMKGIRYDSCVVWKNCTG